MEFEKTIRVGLTERHGMADEVATNPPFGVEYQFPFAKPSSFRFIRSSLKGYLPRFEDSSCNLFEAVFSPIITKTPWILSTDTFHAAINFTLLGVPLPRSARISYVAHMLERDNFKQLILWSDAAFQELKALISDSRPSLLQKATMVYPAVRTIPPAHVKHSKSDCLSLLFSGDFFRKGGANVVDAFERLQRHYPHIRLRICSDDQIDFNILDTQLRSDYLNRIRANDSIDFGRVPRNRLLDEILPETDVYLLPTYAEAFGFSLLEAMAYGLPVIASNEYAIPEIVEHGSSGYLIDIGGFNVRSFVRGYVVQTIPADFHEYVTDQLYDYLVRLIESPELRRQMGDQGRRIAMSKFSFESRNGQMLKIYQRAVS